ncbi:SDR family NAD(P)-dependent oxidoreductase [Streptomyces aurantiogriseus]|uniref:Oxidoreductase n=1 Tax=Streptomyces aurantiogriseus TaxID=66870 RepID=A0A918FJ45_9ACTN|nr:SDR family oxidoreductase [Streptomyces aurantiogriseus]GGR41283.1 oxidoreductase [Streptomyces aurantiogriseus]
MTVEERVANSPYPSGGLLEGKVAVITGAGVAEGIGATCAAVFVKEGAQVLTADISGGQVETAVALGPSVSPFRADVTREEDVEAMFAHALEVFGRVDILVNVAGNPGGRRGAEVTVEEFESLTSVHLLGTVLTNKHAVRTMLPTGGGAIVNFSSAAAFNVDGRISPAYSAAKAGVNAVTKAVAVQYGAQGIRANAVAPGFTLSRKNHAVPPEIMADLESRAALGRAGQPEEQAHVAAFLASDRASFVTGVIVPVDGGWSVKLA